MSLLVNPEWETLLSSVDIPDGRQIKNDLVLQCHLILSLIFYLGISFHNLITFLFETPIAKAKRQTEKSRFFVHRSNWSRAPTIHDLPAELIHSIFEKAILPSHLLYPLDPTRNSAWSLNLRITKGFMQVSKLWYTCAIPFLYESIVIRQTQHIQQLLWSLQNNLFIQSGIETISGRWVRGLHITFDIGTLLEKVDEDGHASYADFVKVLGEVIRLCPLMTTFGYTPPYFCFIPPTFLLTSLPDTITTLFIRFEDEHSLRDTMSSLLVYLADSLTFLSIDMDLCISTDEVSVSHISFRKLEGLHCHGPAALKLASKGWTLPVLSRFTYIPDYEDGSRIPPTLRSFLERNGSHLVSLHVFLSGLLMDIRGHLYIFESCPKIQRLIFPIATSSLDTRCILTSLPQTLQWIESPHNFRPSEMTLRILRSNIPAFKGCRKLTLPLRSLLELLNWVELFLPGLYIEDQDRGFSVDLYTHHIRYTKGHLKIQLAPIESGVSSDSDSSSSRYADSLSDYDSDELY